MKKKKNRNLSTVIFFNGKKVPKKVFPPARVRGPGGATKPPTVNTNLSQSKLIDKTHEEDGDLMIRLHCAYPMSYVSEMISHQTEHPSKTFKSRTSIINSKKSISLFLQGVKLPRQQSRLPSFEYPCVRFSGIWVQVRGLCLLSQPFDTLYFFYLQFKCLMCASFCAYLQ